MRSSSSKKFLFLWIIGLIILGLIPFGKRPAIQYYKRGSSVLLKEKVPGEGWLYWLYYNPIGQLSLEAMVKRKFISHWYGQEMDHASSRDKIKGFVEDYQIDMSSFQEKEYENFNDFFYRKIKPESRPINKDSLLIVSPADGKILVYPDIANTDFIIKGYQFNVQEFLQDDSLAQHFRNPSLMIIRLCPADYHRYHFPVSGNITFEKKVDGDYYSVSPIALKKKVELLTMNKREFTIIESPVFGSVLMMEVGATMVGSMLRTYKDSIVAKGEEKGYFRFGGSTVVLLFEEAILEIDQDLIANSAQGIETEVKMGERIAAKALEHH